MQHERAGGYHGRLVATVQILFEDMMEAEACDLLSELLGGADGVQDWAYLRMGSQVCHPTLRLVPVDYQEGDFLESWPQ